MKPIRKQRLYLILLMVAGVAVAVGFALNAFNENLMFFFSPSQVAAGEAPRSLSESLAARPDQNHPRQAGG